MSNPNKKEEITTLILEAAEQVFYEKGFNATTIEDLSKASNYSRRTIYAYFENKEDILYNVMLKGLTSLQKNLIVAISLQVDFLKKYDAICQAMSQYHQQYPYSFESVNNMKKQEIDISDVPPTLLQIFSIGIETNLLLENFLKQGQEENMIQKHLNLKQTVYILWSNLSSLITLANNKGPFIEKDLNITIEQFLQDGFKQIINSILQIRVY